MNDLASKTCVPCRGGVPPLRRDEIEPLLRHLDSTWQIGERSAAGGAVLLLHRTYRCKNFAEALRAAITIGNLAEEQQHHPDLHVAWGRLGIEVWTHKIGGLTENDFIFAAKCDAILSEATKPSP
ncbi:MAG: 4a-hydroxytetrahydrobiopterin dehydratase [Candidatus Eremiobacteraeota bacterium]|nr:4a-hydroxytetrahydrobiopterin dehydratase [Candidatus Eremiobacteraeota bacterium]